MEKDSLYTFAHMNSQGFDKILAFIASKMEKEDWENEYGDPYGTLRHVIECRFGRSLKQGRIAYAADGQHCCANTGLRTTDDNEIVLLFSRYDSPKFPPEWDWHLKCALSVGDRGFSDLFPDVPLPPTFYDASTMEYGFDTSKPVTVNYAHIFENWERIKHDLPLPQQVVKTMAMGAITESRKKLERNPRLAIPQVYNGKIGWVIPVTFPLSDTESRTLALAIDKTPSGSYRINTMLTARMAMSTVRVLFKPEKEWLLDAVEKAENRIVA